MRTTVMAAAIVSLAAGCASETEPCELPATKPDVDPAGERRAYVVDAIRMPVTAAESQQLSLDLDRDAEGRVDNALGLLLAAVFDATDTDHNDIAAGFIADGAILHIIDVQALALTDAAGVGVSVHVGVDPDGDSSDNFSGSERFAIDRAHPSTALAGHICGGELDAGFGALSLQIALPGLDAPFALPLSAARVRGAVTADGFDGILAGALTEQQVEADLLPAVHAAIERIVGNDCTDGVCEPDSNGELFLALFDEDRDNAVTFEELRDSDLVTSLLAPDVDLYDETGTFNPRADGISESLSIGVGITAVPAQLER